MAPRAQRPRAGAPPLGRRPRPCALLGAWPAFPAPRASAVARSAPRVYVPPGCPLAQRYLPQGPAPGLGRLTRARIRRATAPSWAALAPGAALDGPRRVTPRCRGRRAPATIGLARRENGREQYCAQPLYKGMGKEAGRGLRGFEFGRASNAKSRLLRIGCIFGGAPSARQAPSPPS